MRDQEEFLLEETGLILAAGRWALEQAAADSLRWLEAGLAPGARRVLQKPLKVAALTALTMKGDAELAQALGSPA